MPESHLEALEVVGFIEGGLDELSLARTWRHLDCCEECLSWLAAVVRASRPADR